MVGGRQRLFKNNSHWVRLDRVINRCRVVYVVDPRLDGHKNLFWVGVAGCDAVVQRVQRLANVGCVGMLETLYKVKDLVAGDVPVLVEY